MQKKNIYLIAGHGENDWQYVMDAVKASGIEHPQVAHIGTANGDHRIAFERTREMLKSCGGKAVLAPLAAHHRDLAKARKVIQESEVILISGGEVEDGMVGLPEEIRRLLWERYENGALFIGLSAGTIMMGSAWPHWDDEDNDFDHAQLFDCIGFVPTIFDTHCEDEGWPELKKAVELSPEGFTGYGIPAGGMVIYTPEGKMEATKPLDPFTNIGGRAVAVE